MNLVDQRTSSVLITILLLLVAGAFIYAARRVQVIFLLAIVEVYALLCLTVALVALTAPADRDFRRFSGRRNRRRRRRISLHPNRRRPASCVEAVAVDIHQRPAEDPGGVQVAFRPEPSAARSSWAVRG